MRPARIACLDIGGTKLASAVVEAGGTVHGHQVIATAAADGAEAVLDRAIALLHEGRHGERQYRKT